MKGDDVKLRNDATIGELYGPAMSITDQGEAARYLEALVHRRWKLLTPQARPTHAEWMATRKEAERIELANLGYYAGYCGAETRQRVQRLYGAQHPIFGSSEPTAREAVLAGMVAAKSGMDIAAEAFRAFGEAVDKTASVAVSMAAEADRT